MLAQQAATIIDGAVASCDVHVDGLDGSHADKDVVRVQVHPFHHAEDEGTAVICALVSHGSPVAMGDTHVSALFSLDAVQLSKLAACFAQALLSLLVSNSRLSLEISVRQRILTCHAYHKC